MTYYVSSGTLNLYTTTGFLQKTTKNISFYTKSFPEFVYRVLEALLLMPH